jgi:hypothetical protein
MQKFKKGIVMKGVITAVCVWLAFAVPLNAQTIFVGKVFHLGESPKAPSFNEVFAVLAIGTAISYGMLSLPETTAYERDANGVMIWPLRLKKVPMFTKREKLFYGICGGVAFASGYYGTKRARGTESLLTDFRKQLTSAPIVVEHGRELRTKMATLAGMGWPRGKMRK